MKAGSNHPKNAGKENSTDAPQVTDPPIQAGEDNEGNMGKMGKMENSGTVADQQMGFPFH